MLRHFSDAPRLSVRMDACAKTQVRTASHHDVPIFAARPAVMAIHLAVAATAFGAGGFIPQARAQTIPDARPAPASAAIARQYDIPAGPLPAVLTRFSSEAGIYIAGSTDLTKGKSSPGLKGVFSVRDALTVLLAGTNLQAILLGNGGYGLREKPTSASDARGDAVLPTVQVQGAAVLSATTEGSGSYGAQAATVAGKLPVPLKEIPSSVSVVTRSEMNDRNMRTLDQAMQSVPGVTVPMNGASPGSLGYYSRGYELQIQYDGLPTYNVLGNYLPQFDLAMYDRVEVLKGPSGLLQGSGEPGGSINLVRKRPLDEFQVSGSMSAGSYDNYASDIDVTGPLNKDKTLRGRFVLADDTKRFYWDTSREWHALLYGIVEYDITPRDTVSFSAAYQRTRQTGFWAGLPAKNGQLWNTSVSTFTGADWSYTQAKTLELTADATHRFDNGWNAHAVLTHRVALPDQNSASNLAGSGITDDSSTVGYTVQNNHIRDQWDGMDIYAGGPFELFGHTHTFTIGANVDKYTQVLNSGRKSESASIYDASAITPADLTSGTGTRTLQYGIYSQLRYKLFDPLTLVLGGRASWFRNETRDIWPAASDWSYAGVVHHKFTPFAGLVYDVTNDVSLYGSYTSIFVPQTEMTMNGSVLPPRTGSQYEVGVKGSFLDKRLNTSLAFFYMQDKNRAFNDPNDPSGTYYLASGEVRSQGIEAEVNGLITPNWNVTAGYTYLQTKYIKDTYSQGMAYDPAEPTHSFKLWTNYRINNDSLLDGLLVGGGVTFTGPLKSQTTPVLKQGSVAVFGAQLGYRMNKHWNATLTIDNLFDRRYYQRVGYLGNTNYFGEPRTVMLTLRANY
ncbi:TonB-dependent siderophore receptor [Achromobacter aloeverae]